MDKTLKVIKMDDIWSYNKSCDEIKENVNKSWEIKTLTNKDIQDPQKTPWDIYEFRIYDGVRYFKSQLTPLPQIKHKVT